MTGARLAVLGLTAAMTLGTTVSAQAADPPAQTGECTIGATHYDFSIFMHDSGGGVIPFLGVVLSKPASQFRWVVHEYQRRPDGTLLLRRSWLDDPPAVVKADDLTMGAGVVVPADQIVFKVGAVKQKADAGSAGACSGFTS